MQWMYFIYFNLIVSYITFSLGEYIHFPFKIQFWHPSVQYQRELISEMEGHFHLYLSPTIIL